MRHVVPKGILKISEWRLFNQVKNKLLHLGYMSSYNGSYYNYDQISIQAEIEYKIVYIDITKWTTTEFGIASLIKM